MPPGAARTGRAMVADPRGTAPGRWRGPSTRIVSGLAADLTGKLYPPPHFSALLENRERSRGPGGPPMASRTYGRVLHQIERLFRGGSVAGLSEWQLLDRYAT